MADTPANGPPNNIASALAILERILGMDAHTVLRDLQPQLAEALRSLRSGFTDLQTQLSSLSATVSRSNTTIAELNRQLDMLRKEVADRQKTIDELRGQMGTTEGATTTPLDIAKSFRDVVQEIQGQARGAAGGAGTTMSNMDIEVKGVVGLHDSKTVLFLPGPGTSLHPDRLSVMRMSFGTVPTLPRSTAPPGRPPPPPEAKPPGPEQPAPRHPTGATPTRGSTPAGAGGSTTESAVSAPGSSTPSRARENP